MFRVVLPYLIRHQTGRCETVIFGEQLDRALVVRSTGRQSSAVRLRYRIHLRLRLYSEITSFRPDSADAPAGSVPVTMAPASPRQRSASGGFPVITYDSRAG